jgi:acetyl-CoA synthetase
VVFVVKADSGWVDLQVVRADMQAGISRHLNPLFKIQDVVVVDALPRTASNKVMRRTLRAEYSSRMAVT